MYFLSSSLCSVLLSTLCLSFPAASSPIAVLTDLVARQTNGSDHWVDTWTSMPQLVETANLPPSPFTSSSAVFNDATVRQTLHMSIGAERIRIQISNTFGGSDLTITAASIGLPAGGKAGVSGIAASPLLGLTFKGAASVTIPKGSVAYTDPIDFSVKAQSMMTVSLYLAKGQSGNSITGHPGSRTTSWYQSGNHINATAMSGSSSAHWYFLSTVEAWAPSISSAFVILGDSITDGRGSDTDANDRWPDLVIAKMQANAGTSNIGVVNQAAGGNRVLLEGLGPSLLSRYTRDAITQAGVKYVMIFEGVNDIGEAGTDSSSQTKVGDSIIAAFKQIAADAHKAGLLVFAATITPFCAPSASQQAYSSTTREATRQKVNNWILTSGTFDAVIDFAKVVQDSATVSQLSSKYNSGDYLHPNEAGYQAIANAFPLTIFK